jgi:hypothetical protein
MILSQSGEKSTISGRTGFPFEKVAERNEFRSTKDTIEGLPLAFFAPWSYI